MSERGILAVDDNVIMVNFYKVVFTSYMTEHQPLVVESGAEAMTAFKEKPFKVIVTDLRMPDMSGIDLYKEIVSYCNLVGKSVPYFIFCSAVQSMDKYVEPGEITHPHTFLQKPFKPEDFIEGLEKHLGD